MEKKSRWLIELGWVGARKCEYDYMSCCFFFLESFFPPSLPASLPASLLPSLPPWLTAPLHDLHHVLIGENVFFPHPLWLMLDARPPYPGILEGRDQSAMDPVAEVFDGGMVGVEDDLEGGREGGREEGKKGGKGGREGGLLST